MIRRARRQTGYKPVFEDWLLHTILPVVAYGSIVAGAVAHARRDTGGALFAIAAATLLLVFIGIHNAWDTVTWITLERTSRSDGSGAEGAPRSRARRRTSASTGAARDTERREDAVTSSALRRHVFVTGGTGYIGRALIDALLMRGHTVRALVRSGGSARLPPGVEFIVGNALDASSYASEVAPADTLVQLVGTPHPGTEQDGGVPARGSAVGARRGGRGAEGKGAPPRVRQRRAAGAGDEVVHPRAQRGGDAHPRGVRTAPGSRRRSCGRGTSSGPDIAGR